MVKGRLKGVIEEVDKEKALKLVIKASLQEKTLRLNVMERRATTVEKALELAKQRVEDLQGKLGKTELKLAEIASLLSTLDKELTDLKRMAKARKQAYYNKGFKDTENSVRLVIFQARKFGFMEGWMAAVNVVGLPENSPFRSADQVSLPEDPEAEVQALEQDEDSSEEDEGTESLETRGLS